MGLLRNNGLNTQRITGSCCMRSQRDVNVAVAQNFKTVSERAYSSLQTDI